MSPQDQALTPQEQKARRRGRIMGAAIFLVVLLPMLVAYGVYFTGIGMPTKTINKGDLLTIPQQIADLSLRHLDGHQWDVNEKKRWRWLVPSNGECTAFCEQNLYLTRQVHIRLAEKSGRVERVLLLLDEQLSPAAQDFLAREHPHIQILKANANRWQAMVAAGGFQGDSLADGRYFLMDPSGFVMMSYSPAHSGQDVLDDIKRMLKYSYEE